MNSKNILEQSKNYVAGRGFTILQSPGLLQPRFNYTFSPSGGHNVIDEIVVSSSDPQPILKFAVIPDRSIRMYDAEKIGISNRHLSFFETILLGYAGVAEELPKEESCKEIFNMFLNFGLNPDKLLVTSLGYAEAEGMKIDSSEDQIFFQTWRGLIGHDKVRKTAGRRNLFYARVTGNPGGTGCEIYHKIGSEFVEIGSQVNYKFKFTGGLERTKNAAVLFGFGLERLLMAVEHKEKISDVSTVQPIKDVVKHYLREQNEDDTTINLYDESLTKIADSLRATLFIVYDSKGNLRILNKSQRKILSGFKSVLNSAKSEINYLGIYDSKIYDKLVNATIDLFKERYLGIGKMKDCLLDFIKSGNNS